jgi:DNA-binding MarR family transcriptional regulator
VKLIVSSTDNQASDRLGRVSTDPRLGYLLKHAQLSFFEQSTAALAPFGIDGRELAVLARVGGPEPLSQQEIGARLGVDRTTMVALVDVLERKELVARRPHPSDRRKNVVELTAAGQRTLVEAGAAADAAQERFLAPLGTTGAEDFLAALRTLLE